MATIVRLKRRRNDDPLEALLLATKRRKNDPDIVASSGTTEPKSIFKFAGTVTSKVDGISKQVREAIRKEKLEREFKQHQANIVGDVRNHTRSHISQKSQQNRFKVISKHRANALDALDTVVKDKTATANTDCDIKTGTEITDRKCEKCCQLRVSPLKERDENKSTTCICKKVTFLDQNQESGTPDSSGACKGEKQEINPQSSSESEHSGANEKTRDSSSHVDVQDEASAIGDQERLFNLVDIVSETDGTTQNMVTGSVAEQITCNSEPMAREIVSERPLNDDDYVYDIYYTNSQQFDFRLFERDLTFEAFNNDLMLDREGDGGDDEYVYGDDDDDENDENNWRNDYPDEDPRYIENRQENYDYGDDLDEYVAFETETGNQLADWMSWRCNIDGAELSSDEEDVDHYDNRGRSYEAYYTHVKQEMADSD